jgi:hypothetical protein
LLILVVLGCFDRYKFDYRSSTCAYFCGGAATGKCVRNNPDVSNAGCCFVKFSNVKRWGVHS